MREFIKTSRRISRWVVAAVVGVSGGSVASAELIYGVTTDQFLVSWESADPGNLLSGVAVQGLQSNETVVGIDLRPATGDVYAVGSFSNLYKLNLATGKAIQVGGTFDPVLSGSSFGVDFNPVVDRLRLVSNADQNLRINPDSGVVAGNDKALNYKSGDPNFGIDPNVIDAAYTNNFKGAQSTTLYVIDSGTDSLAIQAPPNDGVLSTVGSIGTDVTDISGFDISGATGVAFLAIRDANESKSTFWTVNLGTGAASAIGEIGGGEIISALTVVPEPASALLLVVGLLGVAGLRRR